MDKPNIGDRVKDKITSFAGIVSGKCEYITGCKQCLVNPPVKADGDVIGGQWFDEDRLEVLARNVISINVTADGPCEPAPVK
jgi:hypothetical protein